MRLVQAILNLDRRVIYTIVALSVAWPLIQPLKLPVVPTPEVKGIFDTIDALPAGSHILIGADFDPASKPELLPFLEAVLAHCFVKDLKPHLLTLWPSGPGLMQTAIEKEAKKFGKQSGVDYCFLGFRYGTLAVVLGMASSIPATFVTDFYGKPTSSMPIYQEVTKISQMKYLLDVAAGATVELWLAYGAQPEKVPMGASCTAVSATQYYPYLQAKQLTGLAGGMKGSAEYEKLLLDKYGQQYNIPPGDAIRGMDAQSMVHLFIVLSIIIANICFFIQTRYERKQRRASA
jgi:hypothetical protein